MGLKKGYKNTFGYDLDSEMKDAKPVEVEEMTEVPEVEY